MTKEEKLARKQQRKAEKVGLGKLILWNSSSCSVALSTLMLGYATFYCTDVLQLAPALVGTLFMVSKIFDSFTDIVAGFIVDRTQTRWGKGRPYEIFMLFLWLSTWLLFSCPTSFATAAKCIWIFCMYTFMNSICVTFLNANNVVYMVRAFENKEQQSKIVGYGSIFTMAGAMVFNVLFPTAMAKVGTDAVGWSRLVGMIAIPLTAIGMLRILTIPEKFTPVSEKNGEQTHLKDLLPLLKESRPVLIICMVRFVQNIATGLGVGTYYWQYIIGNLGMMGVASVTTILVLPLAFALPVLRKKFGMAGMSVIGILVGCIGYLATFFAGGNMVFFIVAALLVSAGAVPLNMMFNMFIADVADYNEFFGESQMHRLYLYYCYQLGILPKKQQPRINRPELERIWKDTEKILAEHAFVHDHKFPSLQAIMDYRKSLSQQMETLTAQRAEVVKQMRRKDAPPELADRRARLTCKIAELRKEDKIAEGAIKRIQRTRESNRIDQENRNQNTNYRNRRRNRSRQR